MPQNPGMSPEVMEAMARRQGGESSPALQQQSPGAPSAQPMPAPIPQGDMTQASGPQGAVTPEAPSMPKFEPQDRQDLITLALIEQLKNDGKMLKEQGKMAAGTPQTPPAPAPQAGAAMGGGGGMSYNYQRPMGGGGNGFSMSPGYDSQPMARSQMQGSGDYSGMNNYGR